MRLTWYTYAVAMGKHYELLRIQFRLFYYKHMLLPIPLTFEANCSSYRETVAYFNTYRQPTTTTGLQSLLPLDKPSVTSKSISAIFEQASDDAGCIDHNQLTLSITINIAFVVL